MELSIQLDDPRRADEVFGPMDRHLRAIRDAFSVQIFARNGLVKVTGSAKNVSRAAAVIEHLQRAVRHNQRITPEAVAEAVSAAAGEAAKQASEVLDVYAAGQIVQGKTPGQKRYVEAMRTHDLIFCTGPAGTGKTYLAVAVAVHLLKHQHARRLILARPAVEAGEKLGFLPGDMQAKVNPYLRPLFDALHDMMDFEQIRRFMANDLIEVIPLAFMRGRTLNDSVIILDEAQNASVSQMLMFLTRMGHGSKMIVTGDDSQIDLPEDVPSGLLDAQRRLRGIRGLAMVRLGGADIVRHRLVQNIVEAYARRTDIREEPVRQERRDDASERPRDVNGKNRAFPEAQGPESLGESLHGVNRENRAFPEAQGPESLGQRVGQPRESTREDLES